MDWAQKLMTIAKSYVVALIDDDFRVLESLQDLLESAGYATRVFASAQDFLTSGALPVVGCVVSDISMPGMNGWELERRVNESRPSLPMIFITAHAEEEKLALASTPEGKKRVLFRKPFNGPELVAAVRAAEENVPSP
jgi:FixJ family two-component response regulator